MALLSVSAAQWSKAYVQINTEIFNQKQSQPCQSIENKSEERRLKEKIGWSKNIVQRQIVVGFFFLLYEINVRILKVIIFYCGKWCYCNKTYYMSPPVHVKYK